MKIDNFIGNHPKCLHTMKNLTKSTIIQDVSLVIKSLSHHRTPGKYGCIRVWFYPTVKKPINSRFYKLVQTIQEGSYVFRFMGPTYFL